MESGGFISDIFYLLQDNMIVTLVGVALIVAMALFRPKNLVKLTFIGLGVAFCLYLITYLFGLTTSGVDLKEKVTDENKYEQSKDS